MTLDPLDWLPVTLERGRTRTSLLLPLPGDPGCAYGPEDLEPLLAVVGLPVRLPGAVAAILGAHRWTKGVRRGLAFDVSDGEVARWRLLEPAEVAAVYARQELPRLRYGICRRDERERPAAEVSVAHFDALTAVEALDAYAAEEVSAGRAPDPSFVRAQWEARVLGLWEPST